jgi:hypothetical protein
LQQCATKPFAFAKLAGLRRPWAHVWPPIVEGRTKFDVADSAMAA